MKCSLYLTNIMDPIHWQVTQYKSVHPCWNGLNFTVLPHMGYLLWNETIWSCLSIEDYDMKSMCKTHSLIKRLNTELIEKRREISVRSTPLLLRQARKIGLLGLSCEIDKLCYIQTGKYDIQNNITLPMGFGRQITDCTSLMHSRVRVIQRSFRHRRWIRLISRRPSNIEKIKTLQSALFHLPCDVIDMIIDKFLTSLSKSYVINRDEHPPVLTIETELFKQLAFADH
jgi:hypothetical protein